LRTCSEGALPSRTPGIHVGADVTIASTAAPHTDAADRRMFSSGARDPIRTGISFEVRGLSSSSLADRSYSRPSGRSPLFRWQVIPGISQAIEFCMDLSIPGPVLLGTDAHRAPRRGDSLRRHAGTPNYRHRRPASQRTEVSSLVFATTDPTLSDKQARRGPFRTYSRRGFG